MIIFYYGQDTYRLKEKLSLLKERFIREEDKSGLNLQKFSEENLDLNQFRQAVLSPPFLAKKKMIIAENFISKSTNQEEILRILDKLPETTILVFVEEGEANPVRKGGILHSAALSRKQENGIATQLPSEAGFSNGAKNFSQDELFLRLKKEKYLQEFKLLDAKGLKQWAQGRFKSQNAFIDKRALDLLIDLVGNDLWRMSAEINKLICWGRGKTISAEDVQKMVYEQAEENIFRFIDALSVKDKKSALLLLDEQIRSGLGEGFILSMLVRQFRILLQIKDLGEEERLAESKISRLLALHPFVVKKSLVQARKFNPEELKNIYRRLLETDIKIKTSYAKPRALLDLFVAGL